MEAIVFQTNCIFKLWFLKGQCEPKFSNFENTILFIFTKITTVIQQIINYSISLQKNPLCFSTTVTEDMITRTVEPQVRNRTELQNYPTPNFHYSFHLTQTADTLGTYNSPWTTRGFQLS